MIALGKSSAVLTHGDHFPARLYRGEHQLGGYQKKHLSGTGQVGWESPYRAALSDVTVLGVGEQEHLTGRNKLANLENTEITSSSTIEQGVVTVVPTGTSSAPGSVKWSSGWYAAKFPFEKGKTYTISLKYKPIAEKFPGIQHEDPLIGVNTTPFPFHAELNQECTASATFTANEAHAQEGKFRITLNDRTVEIRELMVEESDTAHPYEPYCGGIPAPNPDYPIQPEFVEGASLTDGTTYVPLPVLRALPDGNIRDEYDVRTGKLTRRIRELVLNGEEPWRLKQIDGSCNFYTDITQKDGLNNTPVLCSIAIGDKELHRGICKISYSGNLNIMPYSDTLKDIESWTVFLRNQTQNGTPIMVWYPLETPVTEQYDPKIICQHPGYTQLTLSDSRAVLQITAFQHRE